MGQAISNTACILSAESIQAALVPLVTACIVTDWASTSTTCRHSAAPSRQPYVDRGSNEASCPPAAIYTLSTAMHSLVHAIHKLQLQLCLREPAAAVSNCRVPVAWRPDTTLALWVQNFPCKYEGQHGSSRHSRVGCTYLANLGHSQHRH